MDLFQKIIIISLFALQFIVLFQLLYINHKRYVADKKFWKEQEEISKEFLNQLREPSSDVCVNDLSEEGDTIDETTDTDKK